MKEAHYPRIPDWFARTWAWSLGLFLLAAATGAFMRFGLYLGFPYGLQFPDVRHAHSHLMFFGWVTPLLMAFISDLVGSRRSTTFRDRWVLGVTVATALASYPPFLLSGYGFMTVGSRELPLSMMSAGLNGLAWLLFILIYMWNTRRLRGRSQGSSSGLRLAWFDAAVLMLAAATAAGAALAYLGASGAGGGAWMNTFINLFLDIFADGWFGIGVLALAVHQLRWNGHAGPALLAGLVAGLLLRSAGRLPGLAGPLALLEPAGSLLLGVALAGASGALLAAAWRQRRGLWAFVLLLLLVKGLFELALAFPPAAAFVEDRGLRVLFLHAYLLGGVSVGLVTAFRHRFGALTFTPAWPLVAAILVMLASLLPLTGLWPRSLSGGWALPVAALASCLPIAAVLLGVLGRPGRKPGTGTVSGSG